MTALITDRRFARRTLTLSQRVARVLLAMGLLPEGGALRYDRPSIARTKAGTSAPPRADSLALEWEGRFTRLVEAAEHELDLHKRGATTVRERADLNRSKRQAADERLASYVDRSPQFVAFIEDMSTEAVKKWRARKNRDAETGRRFPKIKAPEDDQ